MIKKQSLIVLTFLCANLFGFGQSDIIISQYIETNSGTIPKGIEIFNVSGSDIDFSITNLQVHQGTNGVSCSLLPGATESIGTLKANEVWVIGSSDLTSYSNTNGTGLSGTTLFPFLFNGNDTLELYLGGVLQDQFGICGSDPGTSWSGSGVSTSNQNIQIQNGFCYGDIDGWTDPSLRFTTVSTTPASDMSGFGNAPDSCSAPSIIVNPTLLTNFTYTEGAGPSAEKSFTVEGTNLTDDIDVTPPTNWEISLTTGGAFAATNSITLAQSGGNVASTTIYTRMVGALLNTNSPFSGNISATSVLNAFTENVAVNGNVTPPLAEIVITEIMYNTPTPNTDDEWIEICNVSGSVQDISNYIIDDDGTIRFTFPLSTIIADGSCITIDLGNGNGTDFNVDCPFVADYSSSLGTDTLGNTSGTITLYAANGVTVADIVNYDDGDDSSTDGNGSSYHIIDTSIDNSVTSSNWQAVAYGGSSNINSLLPNCVPLVAEIRVDGNLGTFPNIPDDDISSNSPTGTNNTLFAAQLVGSTQSKSYRIQNFGGLDLNLTSITIIGADSGEFNISAAPASPVIYGAPSILEVTFAPTTAGIKTAVVRITNNDDNTDGDTEEEYTFNIQGEGKCVGSIDAISPLSGPINTIVTVSATGIDLSTASASFNSVPATILNYIVATDELEVSVPDTATDGNLELLDGNGCTGFFAFDVIDNTIGGCEGGANLTNLFISEVTDATTGGLSYIEIYNGTGSPVNLNSYSLEIISNGNSSGNTVALNNVMLADSDTYVVAIGIASSPNSADPGANTCPITGGNGQLADQISSVGGINKKDNEHDMIKLVDSGTTVDEFGVYIDNDWMDSTIITGNRGFNFRRLATASPLPNPTFNLSDITDNWNVIDWVGSGLSSCNTNDYSDIDDFDFSTGMPPSVDLGPTIVSRCNTATISVTGSEGFVGGYGLVYQWYYSVPGTAGWTEVLDNGIYDNVTTAILSILDTSGLVDYQYYCEVKENLSTCSAASNAVQLTLPTTTWESPGTWSNGVPTSNSFAIINYNYNTLSNGNIDACSLTVNAGAQLDVDDATFVNVINNVTIYGDIIVRTSGALVQVDDAGIFTLDSAAGATAVVEKETAPMNQSYEYTYWGSPIEDETIGLGLFEAASSRRFSFKAQNYRDSLKENGNSNNYTPGHDDVDDNISDGTGTDWVSALGGDTMQPGVGYASTHDPSVFTGPGSPPYQFIYTFEGPFNTSTIDVLVYRNDDETEDNNWNFLGNPYPSAIDADMFLSVNTAIDNSVVDFSPGGVSDGAIFFWSQTSPHSNANNGNQVLNFSQADYAVINIMSETAGGDGVTPNRYIPSGQGFFISYADIPVDSDNVEISSSPKIIQGTMTFTNSMRVTNNNDQFFRSTNSKKEISNKDILKLNLTSDNGVFSQMAIGYIDNATNEYDGMAYDTPRNLSSGFYSTIYTTIDGDDNKFAIQGKQHNSLNQDEIIPLGFDTSIDIATLYTLSIASLEGDFFKSNTIYLRDYDMNIVHNLSESDYTFTSEIGEFKERFEIVFTDTSLSINDNTLRENSVSIIEIDSDNVMFKTLSNLNIASVIIFDVLGKLLYDLKGNNNAEVYNLSSLSQATYIAKVELSNGIIVTKKVVKRK